MPNPISPKKQVAVDDLVKKAQQDIDFATKAADGSMGTPKDGRLDWQESLVLPKHLHDDARDAFFDENQSYPVEISPFARKLKGEVALYALGADTDNDGFITIDEADKLATPTGGKDLDLQGTFHEILNPEPQ
jgi:hypothetical protein